MADYANSTSRLQVEQVSVKGSAGGPFVLALSSLCFLSASQILLSNELLLC